MDPRTLRARKERARKITVTLKKLFPDAKMALRYRNTWELLVAVMLSAQCTDKMVNRVTEKLFQKYPTFDDYTRADPEVFAEDIKSTGFYRNKAKNILSTARLVREKFGGEVPDTMPELLTLPGVARKTANVILGTVFGAIEGIAVDTHVKRFARKFDLSLFADPVKIERDLMEIFPKGEWSLLTYRLIEYGRTFCPARKHECRNHPLTKIYPSAARRFPRAR